jgi:AcrR family transcriptional regulator
LEWLYDSGHTHGGAAMGLRDDKKRQTRTAILEGALARFRVEGFASTRVRDITEELQISEATFFNYFPSKQSVLEEAAEELLQRSMQRLEGSVQRRDPVPDRLEDLMEDFVTDFTQDRELAALLGAHTTFFSGGGSERLARAHELVTEMFAEGQRRGEIRADVTSAQLAQLYLEFVLSMIRSWVDDTDDTRPLGERLRLSLSILLRGCVVQVAPSPEVASRADQLSPAR